MDNLAFTHAGVVKILDFENDEGNSYYSILKRGVIQ